MKALVARLRGDKVIWAIVFLLALISFLPVYSASTNLVYVIGKGSTMGYLVKHLGHLFLGFAIIYFVHKVPYHYFRALSIFGIPLVIVLLLYTLFQGTTIGGANASRWIQIPFVGVSFQTSTLAFTVLMVYVARYLAKVSDKEYTFKESFLELWLPVFGVLVLILPTNFSTTALIFSMVCMLIFIGYYPLKYLATVIGLGIAALLLFLLLAKAFPTNKLFSRVNTWGNRIERFLDDKPNEDDYQIEKAKIAIASGGIYGLGPGKSVQKNFLPQSSSDFIFAIIVEEYGLLGAVGILFLYLLLFFRFIINAQKAPTLFGKLLIIGLGFPIVFQALINMAVAVELLPVTGQTLPLISSGGTSIWMTCVAVGVILSVTKKEAEVALDEAEKKKREEALQRIIDREIELEDNKHKEEENEVANPLEPILNQ
ncbi:FtsW/RodA/SpoVE family cell cycle protein [Flavobacterium sp. NRK F7]|uniref:FtsW/RodA/SpoVE family cell cycle protein n=1 Tax=Flavobacterium sp. NRK F7 TaxID=2954930 RepID=UPI00209084FB|nr:FtsW/RodA/SpoVE family cell cycle protein [Flavobacterium sp. NRK F7]MCO6162322.1 FtsW/RodA/SpoVE family cell cycle protein [Flavobacterium sp. NRK F7]|tara:strand:- start:2066 stop:3346 length:1281 start_codon:yes stop_codon:yes gene_type:complete